MKLSSHIIATLSISAVFYFFCRSVSAFIASLAGGILIDVDHFIDYYRHEGFNFRVRHFFDWCYENKWERLILFLHSIELIFLYI